MSQWRQRPGRREYDNDTGVVPWQSGVREQRMKRRGKWVAYDDGNVGINEGSHVSRFDGVGVIARGVGVRGRSNLSQANGQCKMPEIRGLPFADGFSGLSYS